MRRSLTILMVAICAWSGVAAGQASALETRLKVQEECVFRLLPGDGVVLTTMVTLTNARGGRTASVRFLAGWNIGRLYPKAENELVVRLRSGTSARRTVTRRFQHAPEMWKALRANEKVMCASTKVYIIS